MAAIRDLFVINPSARSGRGEQLGTAWLSALSEASGGSPEPAVMRTAQDPRHCHELLVAGLREHHPGRVLTLSGDGGIGAVMAAMMEVESEATLLPLPAGTNNNLAVTLGIPNRPRHLSHFLGQAREISLPLIEARSSSGSFFSHQAILFMTSPDFVRIYERLKRLLNSVGLGSLAHHLAIPITLGRLSPAFVSINGATRLPCSGVLASATAYLAGVGVIPVGPDPTIFVTPIQEGSRVRRLAPMVNTVVEAMLRGGAVACGLPEAMSPTNPLLTISPGGQSPLSADWTRLHFTDPQGNSRLVLPYNDGDVTPSVSEIELRKRTPSFRVATVEGSPAWRQLVRADPPRGLQALTRRLLLSRAGRIFFGGLLRRVGV